MGRLGQGCTACEVASEQVRGAKCAKHASSTSPALTTLRDDHRRGELGPVRYVLAGGDPARLEAMSRKRKSRSRTELGMLIGDDGITLAVGIEGKSIRVVGVDGGEKWSEVQG